MPPLVEAAVHGGLVAAVLWVGCVVGAWVLGNVLRIFAGPSYDESAQDEQRGRDDDGW